MLRYLGTLTLSSYTIVMTSTTS